MKPIDQWNDMSRVERYRACIDAGLFDTEVGDVSFIGWLEQKGDITGGHRIARQLVGEWLDEVFRDTWVAEEEKRCEADAADRAFDGAGDR